MGAIIINILAIAFFPLMAITAYCYWKHWRWLNALSGPIQVLIGAGTVAVFGALFGIFNNQSAIALFVADIFFILVGFGFLFLVVISARSTTRATGALKVLGLIFFFCLGLASVLYFGWFFVGDFFLPRREIVGAIDMLDISSGRRSQYYHVYVDGKRYSTTADVYETLELNTRIRAEVGGGSGTIFKAERLSDTR